MIWTIGDHQPGLSACIHAGDEAGYDTLQRHHPWKRHCGDWEVLAWPCPAAAEVLDRVLALCGHPARVEGCGGCDPAAIEYEFGGDA